MSTTNSQRLPRTSTIWSLLAAFFMAGTALSASAAIAFDSTVTKVATNTASASWAHRVGTGTNMVLVVGIAGEDTTSSFLTPSAISYNGVAMTQVSGSAATAGSSTFDGTRLFYLLNPAAG